MVDMQRSAFAPTILAPPPGPGEHHPVFLHRDRLARPGFHRQRGFKLLTLDHGRSRGQRLVDHSLRGRQWPAFGVVETLAAQRIELDQHLMSNLAATVGLRQGRF